METKEKILVFIISFLLGILLSELFSVNEFERIFFLIFLLGLLVFYYKSFSWKTALIAFLGLIFGIIRFFWVFYDVSESDISNYLGIREVKGCIVDEVDVRSHLVKYTILVEKVKFEDEWINADGKLLVNAHRYPVYEYGDCLSVRGDIQRPGKIEDFKYDNYLSRYGIYSLMQYASVLEVYDKNDQGFFYFLYVVKQDFEKRLSEIFGEPHGGFMGGLILGTRKGISDNLLDNFQKTGLSHIIAISGYNITVLIILTSFLFSFLGRKLRAFMCILFIIFFIFFVGASASVVRAGIMGIIGLLALWLGRQYFVILALFISGFCMVFWNPKVLVYDVGFQLSFMATLGIVLFAEKLEKIFWFLPRFLMFRGSGALTVSAQIMALPIIVGTFSHFSLISPIANMFVLPFIPVSMMIGFLAVFVSYLNWFLGTLVAFLGFLVLELIILVINFFAGFAFVFMDFSWFLWSMGVIYYFFLAKYLLKKRI